MTGNRPAQLPLSRVQARVGGLVLSAMLACAAGPVWAQDAVRGGAGDRYVVPHLFGGADGESHLGEIALPYVPGGRPGSVQSRLHATDVEVRQSPPGVFIDWHGVSTPRLLIILSGQMEIGLGDGSKHILKAGDMVLAADTTGRGHTSRTVGDEPVRTVTVRLPVENSLEPKLDSCPPGLARDKCVAARLNAGQGAPH